MKLSEFWYAMEHEFGEAYSRVLARDLVLGQCDNMTVLQALESGVPVRDVWWAVCETQELPESHRFGPDIAPKS